MTERTPHGADILTGQSVSL